MNRFKTGAAVVALIAALAAPLSAQAHRAWILPSTTTLSGTDGWVGFDAGISNGVFDADHAAMRLDNLRATAPDGSNVPLEHPMQGQWRSTFDVHLTQPGTYRVGSVSQTANATWNLHGDRRPLARSRGRADRQHSGRRDRRGLGDQLQPSGDLRHPGRADHHRLPPRPARASNWSRPPTPANWPWARRRPSSCSRTAPRWPAPT
jgi:hypothetical protein